MYAIVPSNVIGEHLHLCAHLDRTGNKHPGDQNEGQVYFFLTDLLYHVGLFTH